MNKIFIILLVIVIVVLGGFALLKENRPKTNIPVKIVETSGIPTTAPPIKLNKVNLTVQGFEPSNLTIKVGQSVSWVNQTSKNGSVNSEDHPTHRLYPFLNLGAFPASSAVQAKFESKGTFKYHNHFIPSQKGTIVVE